MTTNLDEVTPDAVESAVAAYRKAYAAVESAHPFAWAPHVRYGRPRPLVASRVPIEDRRELGRLARAVERELSAEGDSELAETWSAEAGWWERSIGDAAVAAVDDTTADRVACHGSADPCEPSRGSVCRLGECHARRIAEEQVQLLDRAFARGAAGSGVARALRDCASAHVSVAEIRDAHAQGVAWAAAQARAARVAAWRAARRAARSRKPVPWPSSLAEVTL